MCNPIEKIVDRFDGQNQMAKTIGCAQSTVWNWIQREMVPYDRIVQIIKIGKRMNPPIILEPNDFFAICKDCRS